MYRTLQAEFEQYPPQSIDDHQIEHTRNRITRRTVSVLESCAGLDITWQGLQRLIQVERTGIRGTEPTHETMFYISSLTTDAVGFNQLVRHH